ncbi:RagB/SusD family nutrient uptake outer membrane protein [Hymenobacter negativus]|uniref:RagB/SusD family nutrient uptake outer membrane protein n=1 Tax=Hymenobacter negativus TaxID=2795026 RepID=A0ABS3QK67_9BACT|nr:RagB/SusD family nutrient uptake outer membrane protein [Hymenobacter negativus]MBO2011542.1 RagB/SusD family nutrient uptake outer membrane protein [Hymenobacter negativus]
MNRTHKMLWLAALGLVLTGAPACNPLNQELPTAFDPDEGYATADRIAKNAIGMYDGLQNAEFLGGRALIYSDLRSDDEDVASYFNDISTFTAQANSVLATNAWTGGYRTIYQTNYFLQRLAANTGKTTPALEAQFAGEAKFIRALTYFHLVNLFAQPYNFTADASHPGVVLQLTAPNDANEAFSATQQLPRSTVAQVYAQIEKDLAEALPVLPESTAPDATNLSPNATDVTRATKDAVRGLQSRVALYKGDFAAAAAAAGAVANTRHRLNSSPATVFSASSYLTSESVFSVAMNSSDNPNTNNALGQHYGSNRRADITVTPYALIPTSLFPATDLRRTALLNPSAVPTDPATRIFTRKYSNASADYVPIIRYPEILLTQAEGLAQTSTGVNATAVTLLNQVRDRSKPAASPSYTVSSFTDKQALIEAILLERRLELAFEGHRYYDLLRYKRNPGRINYGSDRVVLPIPLVDIQQNPNLRQNPGY